MSASSTLKIAYDSVYAYALPADHRFPMLKYELIPGQLLHEGTIQLNNLFSPVICPDDILLLTHTTGYLRKLKDLSLTASEQRKIGFPQSAALTHRELVITQGTIDCTGYAEIYGVSLNVAGGTHHAYADRGEGFCLLNDFAVAANWLLHEGKYKKILIIDLDVHQGNGTARIFENEPRVFTFSMHGAHNYPFHKETSDLDIALPDQTGDAEYLSLLKNALSRLFAEVAPEFVFYLSGVDILDSDRYGKLNVTMEGCRRRDEMVFEFCLTRKIPVVVAMGGGYSADIKRIVEAHCNTFRVAKRIFGLD